MHLSTAKVKDMTEATLRDFLELQIPEGHHLDYKAQLPGSWEKAAREFLKDVTAFSNANGGDLIIGANEPIQGGAVDDQLACMEDGESLATSLEQLTASAIEPRIPGLMIKPVALENGGHVIVVHVPPSVSRPHMVVYQKHRTFYIRHTESSVPMSTHEVRESVLASATAEARVREHLERYERDLREYDLANTGAPTFLLQAMPLIPSESPLEVLDHHFMDAVRQGAAGRFHGRKFLESNVALRPTIDGIRGAEGHNDPEWTTEFHRTGYLSACVRVPCPPEPSGCKIPAVYCDLFSAFTQLCSVVLEQTDTDLPYVIRCKLLHAKETRLIIHGKWPEPSDPYTKDEIVWPDQVRQVGEGFDAIAEDLCGLLFNAYGRKRQVQ